MTYRDKRKLRGIKKIHLLPKPQNINSEIQ